MSTMIHNTSHDFLTIPELGITKLKPGGQVIVNQTAAQIKAAVTSVKGVGTSQTCLLKEQPEGVSAGLPRSGAIWSYNQPHFVQLIDAGVARR